MDAGLTRTLERAQRGEDLSETEIVRLFAARGPEFTAVCAAADELRAAVNGETVTYVVNRNINYTNVCYFRCQFCAFSKGKLSENLRLVERLGVIAERIGCSLPELSVAWTLACPGVTGAIVGARRPEQLDGWIGAAELTLGQTELDEVAAALEETGAGAGPTEWLVEMKA